MNLQLPERLIKAILFARGEANGHAWLKTLPRRVDHYLERWSLDVVGVAEGGAMSCCLYCRTADGHAAVLKIPFDDASGKRESRSLQRWARAGASPSILASAPSSGVFLMTRILPGDIAVPSGIPEESVRFCDLLAKMTRSDLGPMRGIPSIETIMQMRLEWAEERFADPGYEPYAARLPAVRRLLGHLMATTPRRHVLHGDLQYKNILIGDGRWFAIDPFTCTGDVNAEAALWAVVQTVGTVTDRITQLAESPQLDEQRLADWCYILAVAEYRSYWQPNAERLDEYLRNPRPDRRG